jgi:hypothetical protein
MLKKIISSLFLMLSFLLVQGQANYFYPNKGNFDASIPTPEQFLGYAIGEQHTRHDRIVAYLKELDRLSDKVSFEIIGETFERRAQVVAIFSSPENHKLDYNTYPIKQMVLIIRFHWSFIWPIMCMAMSPLQVKQPC